MRRRRAWSMSERRVFIRGFSSRCMHEGLVDADITRAYALPSEYYTDAALFSQLYSRFEGCWHFAAHADELEENNILPLTRMEQLLGQSMLLSRSEKLMCLSNVCTHRGMLIAEEATSASQLQCPYHGRTFGLDGSFRSMPEFDAVKDFPSVADDLRNFSLESWKGLLFTSLEAGGFSELADELEARLHWMPVESFRHDPSRSREYDINANWALYVENYLEGFHIPYVHADLHRTLDHDGYDTEVFGGGVLQIGVAREGEPCFILPESSPDHGRRIAAYYCWLFPSTMLNFYPWGLSVNIVVPLDVSRTRIIYRGYVWDESKLGKGAGAHLDKVEAEDQAIVEAVQRGMRSRCYERGRYSPTQERGVHHFHRMLTEAGR